MKKKLIILSLLFSIAPTIKSCKEGFLAEVMSKINSPQQKKDVNKGYVFFSKESDKTRRQPDGKTTLGKKEKSEK